MGSGLSSRIVSLKQADSPNFLIFVQGSWEVANNTRNVAASEKIRERRLASTLLYESSRDWDALQSASTRDYWIKAFGDKTYQDELEELRAIIAYVNREYGPGETFLSGSSYGGGLTTLASTSAPNITRVLLACPQIDCSHEQERINIYRGFPEMMDFLEAISQFHGRLRIICGDGDENIYFGQLSALYVGATTQDKRLVLLPGNHTFTDNIEGYVQEHLECFSLK